MTHVFKGAGDSYGFTDDPAGENLPTDLGPWTHKRDVNLKRGEKRIGVDSDEVLDDIDDHGYHVTSAGVVVGG
jgi:hypothetical protein